MTNLERLKSVVAWAEGMGEVNMTQELNMKVEEWKKKVEELEGGE